jgi:hypothetical protein
MVYSFFTFTLYVIVLDVLFHTILISIQMRDILIDVNESICYTDAFLDYTGVFKKAAINVYLKFLVSNTATNSVLKMQFPLFFYYMCTVRVDYLM